MFTKRNSAVLILLTSDENVGEYWILGFPYQVFKEKGGRLIYRQGMLINGEKLDDAELGVASFLLFNKEVEAGKMKYLNGLLKAPNRHFSVSVEDAEELAKTEPVVRDFLEKAKDFLKPRKMEMYQIDEEIFLHDGAIKMKKYDRAKVVLLLKSISTVADACHYRSKNRYR